MMDYGVFEEREEFEVFSSLELHSGKAWQ